MPIQFDDQPAAPRSRITFDDQPTAALPRLIVNGKPVQLRELDAQRYAYTDDMNIPVEVWKSEVEADPTGDYRYKSRGKPQSQPTLPKLIGGLADNVLPAVSSIPAEVAASATRLLGGGRGRAEKVRQSIQMQPFSQAGRDVQAEILGGVASAVTPWIDAGSRVMDATGASPSVRGALGNTAQMVGDVANVLPVAAAARRLVPPMRGPNTPETVAAAGRATTPPDMADAAGMKIPASHEQARGGTPGMGARVRESMGAHEEHRTATIANRLRANEMVRQDLGFPAGVQMDDRAFQKAREPHAAVYDEVRQLPKVQLGPDFRSAIQSAGRKDTLLPEGSGIQELRAQLASRDSASGAELVNTISQLRANALANSRSTAGEAAQNLGEAQLALAYALEDQLERTANLVDTSLAARYKNARRGFAKIDAVERAMDGYNVDPQKLARYGQRHEGRLDGNLRVVAELAAHYPDAVTGRVPLAKDSDTLAGMLKAPFRAGAQRLLGGRGPTPNPAALEHFRRPDVPVTGGPVDPFASNLELAPDPGAPAAPIPGQVAFADLLSTPNPGAAPGRLPPVSPGPAQGPVPFPELALAPDPGPRAAMPVSPLQEARRDVRATARAGDLTFAPEPPTASYAPSMADLVEWERPMPVGALPMRPVSQQADSLRFAGQPPAAGEMFADLIDPNASAAPDAAAPFGNVGTTPAGFAELLTEQPQGLDPRLEPTSGLALDPVQGEADFASLLTELGVQPSAGPAPFTGDYAPARGFADLTRFNDFDDPPAAAMATPRPRPTGGAPGAAVKLYRGVPEGADPLAAGPAGGTYWTPDRPTAERYGSNVAEREANPADFMDVGTVEELRAMLGAPPEATVEEMLQAFAQRSGRPRGVTYTLPPELEGVPREYFEFAELVE